MSAERPISHLPPGYNQCKRCKGPREINTHRTGGSGICQPGGGVHPCLDHWCDPGRDRTEPEKYCHGHGCLTGDIHLTAPTEAELMMKWNRLQRYSLHWGGIAEVTGTNPLTGEVNKRHLPTWLGWIVAAATFALLYHQCG